VSAVPAADACGKEDGDDERAYPHCRCSGLVPGERTQTADGGRRRSGGALGQEKATAG